MASSRNAVEIFRFFLYLFIPRIQLLTTAGQFQFHYFDVFQTQGHSPPGHSVLLTPEHQLTLLTTEDKLAMKY